MKLARLFSPIWPGSSLRGMKRDTPAKQMRVVTGPGS